MRAEQMDSNSPLLLTPNYMYAVQSLSPIQYDSYPHPSVPRPHLQEEDDESSHFYGHRNASHTSLSPPPPTTVFSSPATMFLSSFMTPQKPSKNPDDEGEIISGYTLGDIIGYGGSSIIRRASSASGDIAAVKIIRRSDLVKAGNAPQARKRLQHEASIWSTLSHEHILPLFSAHHTSHADYFFTLYCPAGSLFDILKRDGRPALPQDDAGMMFRQVVRGLRYLHEITHLVHRDMKLENVLVDEMGMCRIGDFGMTRKIGSEDSEDTDYPTDQPLDMLSPGNHSVHRTVSMTVPSFKRQLGNSQTRHRHNTTHRNSTSSNQPTQPLQPGSLPYAAPELLLPQTSDMLRPHPGQDIWALGVMLYTLLTGRLPFVDSFEPRLQMKILNGVYVVPKDIGRGAERILQGCLEKDIYDRWNIAMVDDIAWGVGWGAEGDDATPTNPDDKPELQHKSRSCSRPPSRDPTLSTVIDWELEEPMHSAFEVASRRSRSRAKRSVFRAPVHSSRSISRSVSRRSEDPDFDSLAPPSFTPRSLFERGRRPNKPYLTSRSPSPSIVPTTPKDDPIAGLLEHPVELHLDSPSMSGRSTMRSSLGSKDESDGKRTVGFKDEIIADWSARTQDMEHNERDVPRHVRIRDVNDDENCWF